MKTKAKFLIYSSAENSIRIFLGKRVTPDNTEFWWIPGGSIEEGEDAFEAAMREVNEELYIDNKWSEELAANSGKTIPALHYKSDKNKVIVMFIRVSDQLSKDVPEIKDEFAEVRWFEINDIPSNMSREFHNIKDYINKQYFSLLR